MRLPDTRKLYNDLNSITDGKRLRCERCGATQSAKAPAGGSYYRSGWPTCCGYTMTLEDTPAVQGSTAADNETEGA
jgi:hypothetical protein